MPVLTLILRKKIMRNFMFALKTQTVRAGLRRGGVGSGGAPGPVFGAKTLPELEASLAKLLEFEH